jgi:hypothetical protein
MARPAAPVRNVEAWLMSAPSDRREPFPRPNQKRLEAEMAGFTPSASPEAVAE